MLDINKVLEFYDLHGNVISVTSLPSFANEVKVIKLTKQTYILKKYNFDNKNNIFNRDIVLEKLRNNGINIPKILTNKNDEFVTETTDGIFEISEYIPHKSINYRELNITEEELGKAAEELALLHNAPVSSNLNSINFQNINSEVIKLINDFMNLSGVKLKKINILKKFIEQTSNQREKFLSNFKCLSFPDSHKSLIHGDFSLTNLLFSPKVNKPYIVDWDGIKVGPAVFEIQRTIGLLCGNGICNANLDSINEYKLKIFISNYSKIRKITSYNLEELVAIAEYCFLIYWLKFTLQQIIRGDHRILNLVPENLEDLLFWETNIGWYKKLLKSII